ncbi:lipopolysaccharide assembly protein LapA domain-containing protein [Plantactinospora sp. CA-294935]|uniref:lipopolysaccharide assembly protein LapA domain-containing protein n=1 Tax=Plantactinospora sp. CA-294935 TaxID=3240012 RepID=UPI003D8AE124
MSDLLRTTQGAPVDSATTAPPKPSAAPTSTSPTTTRMPHTRTGAAWFGICAAALICVVLIVFMLQNTRSVEISFLWMHGTLPLALALLIAGVGVAILTMVVGVARITQLRRLSRRRRH